MSETQSKIKQLPQDLVEKIAAGEVVERPSSVVKELVENALDAGATKVVVEIEKAGTQKICATDNGAGMSVEDMRTAILPHTTSKISSVDDLFSIHTLGFRGEALSTICAVSKVDIISAQSDTTAQKLSIAGGQVSGVGVAAHNQGTSVVVSDLFYNVPARLKFLKTQSVELAHITSLMTQFVLSYPQVSFSFSHNGSSLIDSPSGTLIEVVGHIYGATVSKDALELNHEQDGVRVEGVVIRPTHVRSDKKGMSFFVNGRCVRNSELAGAVVEGYDTLLMIGKYPLCVLNLTIDPKLIDVNVHPRKDIIKIEEEKLVLSIIRDAVSESFNSADLVRDVEANTISVTSDEAQTPSPTLEDAPSIQAVLDPQRPTTEFATSVKKAYVVPQSNQHVLEERAQPQHVEPSKDHSFRLLGIVHKTYAVCEDTKGLVLVDFHAAHERWNYEQFMNQFYNKSVKTQTLLEPVILDVSPEQKQLVLNHEDDLRSWGFDVSEFGQGEIVVRTVPQLFGRHIQPDYVFELANDLAKSVHQNSLEELQQSIITRMSCKASDRAGDDISSERAKQLIQFALDAKMKYACPHGRPTFVRLSSAELEKMFKRRV